MLEAWVRSLAASSVICALAASLAPEGRVKRVVMLVCGLIMTITLVSPIKELDAAAVEMYLQDAQAGALVQTELTETNETLSRLIIEEECEAYILDKAENPAELTVDIRARWSTEGYWYPYSLKAGGCTAKELREKLQSAAQEDLGIPPERQDWGENGN